MKTTFFNIFFLLGIAFASSAANEGAVVENFGKEKPNKGFATEKKDNSKLDRFSLGSQMKFKGEKLIENKSSYINFNTSITYQKGQNSYIIPFKKMVIINSVTFNPNEILRAHSR